MNGATQATQATAMDKRIELAFRRKLGEFTLDVALSLPGTGISAVFGHSGSGKTTLLRCIAGLQAAEGRLSVNGECWQSDSGCVPVHQRALAYVFQEASLFPHLSVRGNLEYGYRRIPASARRIQFEQATEWLGLDAMLDRRPGQLSGGERQRVAIARALLTSPALLLMDEPLSALDFRSKREILPYLETLHRELSIPVIYVTHSADEVAHLADHLVVMEQGRVVASGPLAQTLASLELPAGLHDELGTVLQAEVVERDPRWGLARAAFDGHSLWIPDSGVECGAGIRLRVMASDISLALSRHEDQSTLNLLQAEVEAIQAGESPAVAQVRLRAANTLFFASLTARSVDHLDLQPGAEVWMQIKSVAVIE